MLNNFLIFKVILLTIFCRNMPFNKLYKGEYNKPELLNKDTYFSKIKSLLLNFCAVPFAEGIKPVNNMYEERYKLTVYLYPPNVLPNSSTVSTFNSFKKFILILLPPFNKSKYTFSSLYIKP